MGFGQRQTQAPLTSAASATLRDVLGCNTTPGVGAAGARDREDVPQLGHRALRPRRLVPAAMAVRGSHVPQALCTHVPSAMHTVPSSPLLAYR